MSNAQAVAFASFGMIIIGGGGSFPSTYDVRFGVDNGNGELGTLTSPAEADVRQGKQYGGDGDQYTGTLQVPAAPSGNEFIDCFNELLDAQADAWGFRPTASVAGVTVDILAEVPTTGESILAGAFSEDGTSWVQCLVSPFTLAGKAPYFQAPVIIGWAEVNAQLVNTPASNHGIYRFQIGDATRR